MALQNRLKPLLFHIIVLGLGLLMLYPVFWLLSSSVKPTTEIFTSKGLWPSAITFEHYHNGWFGLRNIQFGRFFLNSIMICVLAVIGTIISSSMAAFSFARIDFPLKKLFFALMLGTIMLPGHVTLIPQYIFFHKLGWVDTFLPLTVPKFLGDAFFIFLIVQFIRGIPRELDESAKIDGCGWLTLFVRIILPLSSPALITAAIFTFMGTWDDFFGQMIYLSDVNKYTVPLGLRLFLDSSGSSNWGSVFAMSVLSIVPSLLIFFLGQKYFTQGIATTGIKG
ncbi:carbohydrate ABC transporter membrane protein 2 (CUT1 family) [Paenibacillus cellulosilyticus]|uniref:Carbohydrate ABC transporter membrane protein 2 (CUT1 family) n=1 Tax=Paenibacillus cellulosilyticus TaxID=375489 RepID=A0A2V2YQR3_9BACL|nr:carbohydrate ABC transporter permease [Paenibacillus cellulosilyticus]PWV99502.1 carbohydrate ABC transporter membrane protein 2 (CUT1 family) [Paenibacillus cellulosilyticus]QKS44755.1 carbohydrate ABC transporter permease [Paenibacillus cellulosilyticus]